MARTTAHKLVPQGWHSTDGRLDVVGIDVVISTQPKTAVDYAVRGTAGRKGFVCNFGDPPNLTEVIQHIAQIIALFDHIEVTKFTLDDLAWAIDTRRRQIAG